MADFECKLKELIIKLYEIGALKFGVFSMKVGIDSPVYFDLKSVVSYPAILESIAELMWEFVVQDIECDQICGVPYGALPIATLISTYSKIPMVFRRKEAKNYGTKRVIEGKFNPGDKCVIVEDVVTSGSSILETLTDLHSAGLDVTTAVVVVDREQGGSYNLSQKGVVMHSLCTLSKILRVLKEAGCVNQETVDSVQKYLAANQICTDGTFLTAKSSIGGMKPTRLSLQFTARAEQATNPLAAKLMQIMVAKESNLCVAADVTNISDVITLARLLGPYVCLFKTHVDIVNSFCHKDISQLCDLAKEHNFLLMEDRKFADIGHIANQQYSNGSFNICSWSDLVTALPVPGEGVITGLKSAVAELHKSGNLDCLRGCFLVVEMSSTGNHPTADYIASSMEMCEKHQDFLVGVVCQSPDIVQNPGLLQLTPGISFDCQGDGQLGQQYCTPEDAVLSRGADIGVVGRGITKVEDPIMTAKKYRDRLWAAYEKRVGILKRGLVT